MDREGGNRQGGFLAGWAVPAGQKANIISWDPPESSSISSIFLLQGKADKEHHQPFREAEQGSYMWLNPGQETEWELLVMGQDERSWELRLKNRPSPDHLGRGRK